MPVLPLRALRFVGPAVAAAVFVAGCGTRVDGREIVAAAGAATVSFDEATLARLRSPAPVNEQPAGRVPSGGAARPAAADSGTRTATPPTVETAVAPSAKNADTPAAPAHAKVASPTQPACRGPAAPLALGQVGTFSGVLGPLASGARTALAVWAKDVNARGGLACHPVQIYTADDGGDPARAAAAIQSLVAAKDVQAFVGIFTPASMAGVVSAVDKVQVPVVGGDVVDFAWNRHPLLYPQGAGSTEVIRGALHHLIDGGKRKVALVYCVEATVCTSAAKVIGDETRRLGGELVYSSGVSLTQPDFTAQCQNTKNAGADVLAVALDGGAIGRVARSCKTIDYFPPFVGNGLILSAQNAADPDIRRNTFLSAGPNAPFTRTDTEGQREYRAAMGKYAPSFDVDTASLSTWTAAKLLEAAVAGLAYTELTSGPITTSTIVRGLGTIRSNSLGGLAPPLTFRSGQKSAPPVPCVFLTVLRQEGWTAANSKPVCT